MTWNGRFHFGKDWATYRGASADNALHAHVALQMCFSSDRSVTLKDRSGHARHGPALYVRSCIPHRLEPIDSIQIILVEPHSVLGRTLLTLLPSDEIGVCPQDVAAMVDLNAPLDRCLRFNACNSPSSDEALDPRLEKCLARLMSTAHAPTLADLARDVGLSSSRLRHLAMTQLGLPLSKYVLWRKLSLASRALAAGDSLAEAAVAGGFTDQAHFTKSMRALIGLTPGAARQPLF